MFELPKLFWLLDFFKIHITENGAHLQNFHFTNSPKFSYLWDGSQLHPAFLAGQPWPRPPPVHLHRPWLRPSRDLQTGRLSFFYREMSCNRQNRKYLLAGSGRWHGCSWYYLVSKLVHVQVFLKSGFILFYYYYWGKQWWQQHSLKERRRLAAAVEELEARGATQVYLIYFIFNKYLNKYQFEARGATQVNFSFFCSSSLGRP